MPTNTIAVEWAEGKELEATVWDNNGVQHDIRSIFLRMSGGTGVGGVYNRIELGSNDPGGLIGTRIEFRPSKKELKFATSQKVIDQILEALP